MVWYDMAYVVNSLQITRATFDYLTNFFSIVIPGQAGFVRLLGDGCIRFLCAGCHLSPNLGKFI